MNINLYQKVLNQIKAHPETWEQNDWHSHCGTKHCFAGWAAVLTWDSYPPDEAPAQVAKELLDLTPNQASYLFNPDRTLSDFDKFLEKNK